MIEMPSTVGAVIQTVQKIRDQIPYATARALNATAKEVQQHEITNLKDKLTIRTDWWTPGRKFGINAKFATKDNQIAVVSSQSPWLDLQERGGDKRATTGKGMAVPTSPWKKKGEIMEARKKPKAIFQVINRKSTGRGKRAAVRSQGQQFFAVQSFHGKPGGLFVRYGQKVRRLFTFESSTRIKARLQFGPTGVNKANEIYERHFDIEFTRAIATMK